MMIIMIKLKGADHQARGMVLVLGTTVGVKEQSVV